MSSNEIVGRKKEQKILERFLRSPQAEFLALYGRRRVGKTYLVRTYFSQKKSHFFYASGIHHAPMKRQLNEFLHQMRNLFYPGLELKEKSNWSEVFELLTQSIQQKISKKEKIVLFFDELPWMAAKRSDLLEALDYYWNRYWSHDPRIKLIICGSAASWIIRNVVDNKGGLHNRLTHTMLLEPFDLLETQYFLRSRGITLNQEQVTQLYMVLGGIPYYLAQVSPGSSATQMIEQLAFTKNSFLLKEFDNLYSALFNSGEEYILLVRYIAEKRYGISQEELFEKIKGSKRGGTFIKKLKDLEIAGFIQSFKPFQNKKKGIHYKMIDEYTLFYLYWIEPIKDVLSTQGFRTGYWQKVKKTPSWYTWAGYSFEALCYKHVHSIAEALNLSPTARGYTWRYVPSRGSAETGVQIDLLFDRDDDAISLCEIKYTQEPFAIDKSVAAQLQSKMDAFQAATKTKKQLFWVLINNHGLKTTMYAEAMVAQEVRLSDLFTNV